MASAGRRKVFQTNSLKQILKVEKVDVTLIMEYINCPSSRKTDSLVIGLCHLMTDRLSSQTEHTKLSSQIY